MLGAGLGYLAHSRESPFTESRSARSFSWAEDEVLDSSIGNIAYLAVPEASGSCSEGIAIASNTGKAADELHASAARPPDHDARDGARIKADASLCVSSYA